MPGGHRLSVHAPPLASDAVHLRRALLLFSIVLGVAAVAASVSQPGDERATRPAEPAETPTPYVQAGRGPSRALVVRFGPRPRRAARRVGAGRAATVVVRVPSAGSVELAGLGLQAPGDALTPARFELFTTRAGRYRVRFSPAANPKASRRLGTLAIVPQGAHRRAGR